MQQSTESKSIMGESIYIRTRNATIYTETTSEKLWRDDDFFKTNLPARNFRVSVKCGPENATHNFSMTATDKASAAKQVKFLVGQILKEKNIERAAYNLEGLTEWHFIANPSFKHVKRHNSILGKVKKIAQRKLVELFELED